MASDQQTILAAVAAQGRRELSATELVEAAVERIRTLNGRSRALIAGPPEEQLREEARRIDSLPAAEAATLPLRGVPIALKANFDCAGVPSSAGSRILRDRIPTEDAATVAGLRRAGAIVVGMANMNEFANGPTGRNPHYGDTRNPWDPERLAGGSSGGSAVAVALGMCLGATGSDTGGSIRTPSAFCGTVGLKPSRGALSTAGVFPFSRTLDHVGPIARTVADAELLLAAMGGDPGPRPVAAANPEAPLAGLAVGVETAHFGRLLQAGVRESFERAVDLLRELGATVQELRLEEVTASLPTLTTILFSEAAVVHERWLDERPRDYADDVRESLLSGRRHAASDYLHALERRAAIRAEIDRAFERIDFLATPTTIVEAPALDAHRFSVEGEELDGLDALIHCTAPFNLSGHPAISVPCGLGPSGTPLGLQIVAPHGSDSALLSVAGHFESAAGERLVPPFERG